MDITRTSAERQREGTFVAEDLKQLLGRPIAYQRIFAHLTGDPGSAVWLSQALYWSGRATHTHPTLRAEDGWFYKTQAECWEETGLTRFNQEAARRKLRTLGILIEQRGGQQGNLFHRLDLDRLAELLKALIDNKHSHFDLLQSSSSNRHNAAAGTATIQRPLPNTETTSETTASRRARKSAAQAPAAALDDGDEVAVWLQSIGVGQARAKRLAAQHADELARRRTYLPFVENVRDPARLVTARLDEPWDEPAAAREATATAERAAARRADARQAAARRAEERAAAATAQDESATLDAQLAALPPEERAAIDAEVEEQRRRLAATGVKFTAPPQVLARNILRERLKKGGS
jgi:hypothetical protein